MYMAKTLCVHMVMKSEYMANTLCVHMAIKGEYMAKTLCGGEYLAKTTRVREARTLCEASRWLKPSVYIR